MGEAGFWNEVPFMKVAFASATIGWLILGNALAAEEIDAQREAAGKAAVRTSPSASQPGTLVTTTTIASVPDVGAPGSVVLTDQVRKYVATHRPLSIELGAMPMVGNNIPPSIRLRDIPGSPFRYVYVDGQPVFVDAQSRLIVQVGP